jgi:uncharacterized protein YjbI with pentapeptide repeats
MKNVNLTNAKLHNAHLPVRSSGLLEGVRLAGAEGWMPVDKDLKNAKLKGADLSVCNPSDFDLTSAHVQNVNFT